MTLTRSFWPADTSESVIAATVGDLLRDAAADAPELTALIAGHADPAERRGWSYAELLAEAERAARALLEHVSPGERIAIWAPNVPEWVVLEFAAALAGAVVVSLNPAMTEIGRLADVLARSHTAALFYLAETRDRDVATTAERLRAGLPELRTAIPLSRWADFVARADPGRPLPRVSPETAGYIAFTSGTTGCSTGVVHRHQAIVNNARFAFQRVGLGRGETLLPYVPMHHGTACDFCVPGAVWHRATLVLPEVLAPGPVSELLETCRAQMLFTVPARLTTLVEDPGVGRRDLRALHTVVTATAPSRPALIRAVESGLGCRVVNVYGQTEASAIAAGDPTGTALPGPDAVGRPLPRLECKIVDLVTEQITDLGFPGELCVRGYQVMIEYLDAPEETANRLDPYGWLRTGDVATMDEHGRITITGRIREVITRDGEQIYPREVENRLCGHPEVGDAIVLGLPDPRRGQQVVAVIRPAPGTSPTPARLREYCLRNLAPYKAPTEWYFVDTLPLCGPGKIKKYELREHILAGRLRPAGAS